MLTSELSWKKYTYHVRVREEHVNTVVKYLENKYNTDNGMVHWHRWANVHFGLMHEKDLVWITLNWI